MADQPQLASNAEPSSTGSSLSQAPNQDQDHQHDSVLSPLPDTHLLHAHSHSHSHSHSRSHSHSLNHSARFRSVHSRSSPPPSDTDGPPHDDSQNDDDEDDDNNINSADPAFHVVEEVHILLESRQADANIDDNFVTRVVQTVSLVQHVDQLGNPVRTETVYAPPNTEVVDPDTGNTVAISAPGSSRTAAGVPGGTDPAASDNVPPPSLPPYPTTVPPEPTLPPVPTEPAVPAPPDTSSVSSELPVPPESPASSILPPASESVTSSTVIPIPPVSILPPPPPLNATSTHPVANSTSASTFSTDTDRTAVGHSYTSTPSSFTFTSSIDWSRTSSYSDFLYESSDSYSTDFESATGTLTDAFGDATGGGSEPTAGPGINGEDGSEGGGGGGGGSLSQQDRQIVGGVVGGVAGAAFFLLLVLLALKYKKRRDDLTEIIGDRGANPQSLSGAPGGPAGSGGGDGQASGAMAERSNPFVVPAALASLTAKRGKPTSPTSPTSSTGERGFVRVSGRKLPSVLQHGGDGYTDPRESVASGQSDYFRGSQEFVPSSSNAGHARLALGSPMRPVSGVPIMRSGPARTPIAAQNPFADPPSPPIPPPPRDPLGRSLTSQDGSRGSSSRFHEAI